LISAGAPPQTQPGSLKRSPKPLAGFKGSYLIGDGGEGRRKEKREVRGRRKRWMTPF